MNLLNKIPRKTIDALKKHFFNMTKRDTSFQFEYLLCLKFNIARDALIDHLVLTECIITNKEISLVHTKIKSLTFNSCYMSERKLNLQTGRDLKLLQFKNMIFYSKGIISDKSALSLLSNGCNVIFENCMFKQVLGDKTDLSSSHIIKYINCKSE